MAHARAGGLVSYTTASHTGCCRACNSQSTHSPLSWACGREHRQASGGERESSWSPGGTSGAPRVSPAPSQESAGPLLGRRRVRESVTESSWPPRGTSRSAQGVACTVTVLRLRAWTSVPCSVLGPCVQYKSMPDLGLSGVQPTVNSQSTHSQLDSQLNGPRDRPILEFY